VQRQVRALHFSIPGFPVGAGTVPAGCWYLNNFIFGYMHFNAAGNALFAGAVVKSLEAAPPAKALTTNKEGQCCNFQGAAQERLRCRRCLRLQYGTAER
jgi:hypothetical protein